MTNPTGITAKTEMYERERRIHELKAPAYLGTLDRNWAKFDLSDCSHQGLVPIVSAGNWDVEICARCGAHLRSHCRHRMTWNSDGTVLLCVYCGVDGT